MVAAYAIAKMETERKYAEIREEDLPEIEIIDETADNENYFHDISNAVDEAFDRIIEPNTQYMPVGKQFPISRFDEMVKKHCAEQIRLAYDGIPYDPDDIKDIFEPIPGEQGGEARVYLGYGQVPDEKSSWGYKLVEYFAKAAFDGDPATFRDAGEIQSEIDITTRNLDRKIVPEVYEVSFIEIEDGKVIPITIMETVHGKHLSEITEQYDIPKSQKLEAFKRYVENIGAMHDAGYVHRDIKPKNVKIEKDGNARVIDFGLAAKIGKDPKSDSIGGTPEYMSPEHLENRVDPRMDVYSLGCVLYEILLGKAPYSHVVQKLQVRSKDSDDISPDNVAQEFSNRLYGAMVSEDHGAKTSKDMQSRRERLSENLGFIVDTCIRRNPDERFSSCDALAKALDAVIEQEKELESIYTAVNNTLKKGDKPGSFEPKYSERKELTEEDTQLIQLIGGLMEKAENSASNIQIQKAYFRPETQEKTCSERTSRTKLFGDIKK